MAFIYGNESNNYCDNDDDIDNGNDDDVDISVDDDEMLRVKHISEEYYTDTRGNWIKRQTTTKYDNEITLQDPCS